MSLVPLIMNVTNTGGKTATNSPMEIATADNQNTSDSSQHTILETINPHELSDKKQYIEFTSESGRMAFANGVMYACL